MNWQFLVLINVIAFSVARLLQKVLLQHKKVNAVSFSVASMLPVSLLLFVYVMFTGFEPPDLVKFAPNLLLMAILYAMANLLMFKALERAQASEVTVLASTLAVWSMIGAAIFLNESITRLRILGTALILLGALALSWRGKKITLKSAHLFALLSAIFFGLAFVNDIYIIGFGNHVPSYLAISFPLSTLPIIVLRPRVIKELRQYFDIQIAPKLFLIGALYAIAAITFFSAYQLGAEASQLAPIGQSSILVITILSYFFLNERDHLINKIAGTILVFSGVVLLV